MALQATIYTFNIERAGIDRGVYESPSLRLARHPFVVSTDNPSVQLRVLD